MTRTLGLARNLTLTETVEATAGAVVVGKVLNDKTGYNALEDVHGRMSTVHSGDLVVGALGHRNALQGYEGVLPPAVHAGQKLNLLNLGGVIGACVSFSPEVGAPFEIEILGQVLAFPDFASRIGKPATIQMNALAPASDLPQVPVIYIAGTCMNSGKTAAACALVRRLSKAGWKIGAAKLTGVSLVRDILAMKDYGADWALDFTDAGVATSDSTTSVASARTIFSHLAQRGANLIVAETGDGIMGEYGVQEILEDAGLMAMSAGLILCANDPVGVAGGVHELRDRYGLTPDVIAGPATDNRVGSRFVENTFAIPAINARVRPDDFAAMIQSKLEEKCGSTR